MKFPELISTRCMVLVIKFFIKLFVLRFLVNMCLFSFYQLGWLFSNQCAHQGITNVTFKISNMINQHIIFYCFRNSFKFAMALLEKLKAHFRYLGQERNQKCQTVRICTYNRATVQNSIVCKCKSAKLSGLALTAFDTIATIQALQLILAENIYERRGYLIVILKLAVIVNIFKRGTWLNWMSGRRGINIEADSCH